MKITIDLPNNLISSINKLNPSKNEDLETFIINSVTDQIIDLQDIEDMYKDFNKKAN
ncbi:hypothetical protein RD055328_12490 [Companilactobacillus sp. RD055328]|uniref:hypothetical protein n=1 Tax=Companilactobacillus sp. RD055328 TaxID=2916634 RepID=UPI001FC8CF57|nr:hypothetical protein [Companilactobacillus sp. RD055328]GKQ43326.1 hypothetical protein RD055328_12490 [Companilactobacillus sp. RD055328]